MDCRCMVCQIRLARKFIHCCGEQALAASGLKGDLRYSQAVVTYAFQLPLLLSIVVTLFCSFSYSFPLSYFINAVPMSECLGKHWCSSSNYGTELDVLSIFALLINYFDGSIGNLFLCEFTVKWFLTSNLVKHVFPVKYCNL